MSAPSFVISVAPVAGQANASKRGAAAPEGDFAAVLDAVPVQADVDKASPTASKPAQPPVEDVASDVPTDVEMSESAAVPFPAIPVPVPVPVAQPAVLTAEPLSKAALVGSMLPTGDEALPFEPETTDEGAEAGQPSTSPVDQDTDQIAPRAPVAEQAKAPTPTPTATAPSTPPPAAAATTAAAAAATAPAVTALVAAETTEPAPRVTSPSSPEPKAETGPVAVTAASQPKVEAPRIREATDRVQSIKQDNSGTETSTSDDAFMEGDAEGSARGETRTAFQSVSSAPAPTATFRLASEPVIAPVVTPETPETLQAAPPVTTDVRHTETSASLALSTLSHATIETTAQIAAQIVRKLESRSTRFEMALTPDGLGQVDISMDIDNDGKLVARLAFDNPLAATEMRGRVDDLRRQLQEAGFTVADDALSFTERDPAGQFFGQGGAFDRRPDGRGARAFGAATRIAADADNLLAPARWIPLALTPDRVDMKV